MPEPEPHEIARSLARPDRHPHAFGRRRFLLGAAAVGGGALLADAVPGLRRVAAAVTPLGPADGVLVVVELQGGNDALNTVVPLASGRYVDRRGALAIGADRVLPLDAEVGLHPSLAFLGERWRAGSLAIVEGVGDPSPDLSHFTSMARWMSASPDPNADTGWLGRYLDQLGGADDAFASVTFGSAVPLLVHGSRRSATALGEQPGAFGTSTVPNEQRLASAVRDLAARPNERGAWADAIAAVGRSMVDVNRAAAPLYTPALASGRTAGRFDLAARLINADLGMRVLHLSVDGFDTHAGQLAHHASLLSSLDAGLRRFFATLTPVQAGRTAVLVVSEFGRKPAANDSGGTDHGTAGVHLLLGDRVRGGRYGRTPSLDDLDGWGRLRPTVDQRSVFSSVLTGWLGADARSVLDGSYEVLDVFRSGPSASPAPAPVTLDPPPGRLVPVTPVRVLDTRVGTGAATGAVAGASAIDLVVAGGTGAAPPTATSVVLNVTVTEPRAAGFVTVWPAGAGRPLASNLNYAAGQTVPNLVVTPVGAGGAVSLYASAGAPHLVADLVGYAGDLAGSTLVPVAPFRLLDTRADAPLRAGAARRLRIAGSGPVPAGGVSGVVMNVTVTEPTADGYLTVWPGDAAAPLASNLNVERGGTAPNLVVARVDAAGEVQLAWSTGEADVVVDVVAFLTGATSGLQLRTTVPTRLLDTRDSGRPVGPGGTVELAVAGVAGVPATAGAAVLNVTATDVTAPGFVTVSPAGRPRPLVSTLNLVPGRTVANLTVALLGDGGRVWLYNAAGDTHLVADVVGWFE